MVLLVLASVVRRVVPMRWFDRVLGTRSDPATPTPTGVDAAVADRVRWAIGAAGRRLPWQPSCVPEALAGAVMLRRRAIPYRITIGVAADEVFEAHAWLEAGTVLVTGGRSRD